MDSNTEFDYIIVGGGVAGCVVAGRLHEYLPTASILIVEAGPHAGEDSMETEAMGLSGGKTSHLAESIKTVPQKHLNNAELLLPTPRVLSGGGVVNSRGWLRPARVDCDAWAEVVGDDRYSYDKLLSYFKRSERCVPPLDSSVHGNDGPTPVVNIDVKRDRYYPLREPLERGYKQLGMKYNPDVNSGDTLGYGGVFLVSDQGLRTLPYNTYKCSEVQTITECPVARILFSTTDGQHRATGIECIDGRKLTARKEVILSAGAINSPKLLLLSGIGPANDLKKHNIPMVVDNSSVGTNLADHLAFRQLHRVRDPKSGIAMGSPQFPTLPGGTMFDFVSFIQHPSSMIQPALDIDDVPRSDVSLRSILNPGRSHIETIILYIPMNNYGRGDMYTQTDTANGSVICTNTIISTPTSRGTVTLSSSNPEDAPLVDPNYYSTETDRVIMREGVRNLSRLLYETEPLNTIISSDGDMVPDEFSAKGPSYSITTSTSDDILDERIAAGSGVFWHPMGSCSMGQVVTADFKVRGIDSGLRIIDASVFPVVVGTHPQCMVYAVAEVGAEIIAGEFKDGT